MNTCDTCKYWERDRLNDFEGGHHFARCLHPKLDYSSDEWIKAPDGAVQFGMDAGYVQLGTGPKFGCVLHAA
ncbi:MAG: hypothetical protein V4563_14615 [Pseudomonadota bacterium]